MALVQGAASEGVYAEVYINDGSSSQSSLGTTPAVMDWSGLGAVDGVEQNCDADAANDRIVITHAGVYEVHFDISFSGTAGALFTFKLRIGGVEQNHGVERQMCASGLMGNCGFDAKITFAASDIATIYVETDDGAGSDSMTVATAHFSVQRIPTAG